MSHIVILVDDDTGQVDKSYWRDGTPDWASKSYQNKTIHTTHMTPKQRAVEIAVAKQSVDYDPQTERVSLSLYYDETADTLSYEASVIQ